MSTLLTLLALGAAFWCGLRAESWARTQVETTAQRECKHWKEQFQCLQSRYMDLIWQVGMKWPGETRHQTAKRYIAEREQGRDYVTGEKVIHG